MGFKNYFFCAPDFPDTELSGGFGAEVDGDIAAANIWREEKLLSLRQWFLRPRGDALSIAWLISDAERKRLQEAARRREPRAASPPEFLVKHYNLKPTLVIQATNVLEAIAATIYVDREHGVRYAKCENCGKLFKKESEHGQKYCRQLMKDGRILESCKNAATQREWRKRQKELQAAKRRKGDKSGTL